MAAQTNALDRYDVIVEVRKFNPYHDRIGRFTTPGGAASFTWKPGASADHDRAIQNEKLRAAGAGSAAKKPKKQTSQDPADKWRPDWMPENHRRNHEKQNHHPDGEELGAEAVKAQTGCSDQEALDMYAAVSSFSRGGYEAIRRYAYEGPPPSTRQADAENLEKFISSSPQWDDGPLYRGINVDSKAAQKILADARAGKPLGQRGPASWSTDRDVAEDFSYGSEDVSIIFKTTGKQNGTSIKHLSAYTDENEVLMSNDARWRPVSDPVEVSPGVWEIECEAIDVP